MKNTLESKLSVIVLTMNEELNLPSCLQSLKGLDGEIFVVDSGSTDQTLQIAESAAARIFHHPFEHYGAQRNWAQENLPISGEWVLHLDADERLTPELVTEINHVFQNPPSGIDGFMLRKRTIFMGRWIRHGGHYPSYHLRLFRRKRGSCEDRLYDQHFLVDGKVLQLKHDYLDIVASNLHSWTLRHSKWAELEAREILRGERIGNRVRPDPRGNPIEKKRWLREGVYLRGPLFARAFLYWLYRYVFRLGFLDGKEGLIFHFLQGGWFRFLVDATLYEDKLRQTRVDVVLATTRLLPSKDAK
jgi:glycosyltransferase involved in cell wall biosynthesis